MPPKNRNRKPKQKRFQYSVEVLTHALEEIRAGKISANKASKEFGIPKGTLINKIHSENPTSRKMGPKTIVSPEDEKRIETWVVGMSKVGFPLHAEDLKDTVQKVMTDSQTANPFTNDRPGKKWLKLFLKRHPEIAKKNTEVLSKSRAAVTEQGIKEWFYDLEQYLESENASDILEDGTRILNLDETGMSTCPKTGKILGPKGYRNLYDIAPGPEKESITVLCTFSASGDKIDPMIIYPYKRIPRDVADSVPNGVAIGRSDSGWMVSATFYEYVANVLDPWLVSHNVKRPVLLFLDGHKSHVNEELHNFCVQKQILLFCLLPNATHILQPCDVGIFKPLKSAWKTVVRKFKLEENKAITKVNFACLFCKSFSAITKEAIVNSFKACGIFPFKPENVDYSKCMSNRRKEVTQSNKGDSDPIQCVNGSDTTTDYRTALKIVELELGNETVKLFNQVKEKRLEVDEDQRKLYQLWERINQKYPEKETQSEITQNHLKENETKQMIVESVKDPNNQSSTECILQEIQDLNTSKTTQDPWEHHLKWPKQEKSVNLKRKREKIPFAATSQEWKRYHDEKVKIKEEKDEGIKKRKLEREEKKKTDEKAREQRKEEKVKFNEWMLKKNEEIKMRLSLYKKI